MAPRLILPGLVWFGAMILLFITPMQDPPQLYFGKIPSRSVVHGIMFLGLTHTCICALKRQLKHLRIREKAILIVSMSAVLIAILAELFMWVIGVTTGISVWNLLFDGIGILAGIGTFKLLYHPCC